MICLRDMGSIQAIRLVAALLTCSSASFGQAGKSELFGTVQDPSALPIRGARILATELATGSQFETVTGERGDYHLLGLPAGQYSLSVEQAGFRTYKQAGIVLRLGDQTELDVQMQIGQAAQTIDVTAQTSLLQTASGSVSFNVDGERIETLPLDGRNFIPLVALSPGVALPGGGSLLPRINGSRPRTNEYMYDGISASCSLSRGRWSSIRLSMGWRSSSSTSTPTRRNTGDRMAGRLW